MPSSNGVSVLAKESCHFFKTMTNNRPRPPLSKTEETKQTAGRRKPCQTDHEKEGILPTGQNANGTHGTARSASPAASCRPPSPNAALLSMVNPSFYINPVVGKCPPWGFC